MNNMEWRRLPDEERAVILARMDAAIRCEQAATYARAVLAIGPLVTAFRRFGEAIAAIPLPVPLDTRTD